VTDEPISRGDLADDKTGESADPGHPQPEAAEVESARQLENEAATRLAESGISRDEARRLADEYVALDVGEDVEEFIAWAKQRRAL
jgi:hypothetical protein